MPARRAHHDDVEKPSHVAFFGTYDERRHPRVRVLREGLIDHGYEVSVANVPLDLDTAGRVRLASRPWRSPQFFVHMLAAWARLLWRSRGIHGPDAVVVGYLGHFDIHLARCRWPRARIVLDHMVSLADTVRDRGLDRLSPVVRALDVVDRAAIAQADIIVVDTAEHLRLLAYRHRSKAIVVPVGAPNAWFDARDHRTRSASGAQRPLGVVFFGLFTPLQGTPTIGRAIYGLADRDIRWTIIGNGQDHEATKLAAGDAEVTWVDWVEAEDLPGMVADHEICLGIFGTGPKARRVVPNKAYQGAAAGCALVTADTPAQRAALGDAALYTPPGDADSLARVIGALADDASAVMERRRAAAALATRAFTPAAVVAGLVDALSSAHDDHVPRPMPIRPPLPPNAALRWDIVSRHVESIGPASILECGAGQGAVAARLSLRAKYVGIEPDPTSRATAASRVARGARLLASVDELADDESYDLLCAFEVLEHLEDDKGALARWIERLQPGGHVLVSVPADSERFGAHDELAGHLRRYSTDALCSLFEAVGLVTLSVEHYGFPLGVLLEIGRNSVASRRLGSGDEPSDLASRTARSGRHLQPPAWTGAAIWWTTAPFRHLQRRFPDRGTGLVGVARRPA